MQKYSTEDEHSTWVIEQLRGSNFLYQNSEKEVCDCTVLFAAMASHSCLHDSRGAFHGPLVLETFAFHLQAVVNAPCLHGNPIAALAVSASAVCLLVLAFSSMADPFLGRLSVHLHCGKAVLAL